MVSTSDRLKMRLDYAPGAPADLPRQVAVKMKRSLDAVLGRLYNTEVNFYVRLRPSLDIETPKVVGGVCDLETALYYLLIEDVSLRGARFPNATTATTVDEVRAVLDVLARLHGQFWESPRLKGDLTWYDSHWDSETAVAQKARVKVTIARNVEIDPFKQEVIAGLGADLERLHAGFIALQRYQSTLPQTILHGDAHIGNSYLLPGGGAGMLDWQLTARGAWAHDVNYLILTALDVETRRREERGLVAYYLDALRRNGVQNPPDAETAWLEYRRAMLWSFYIGWLTTPVVNYGAAINRANLTRTSAAIADHGTLGLVDAVS
jgi:hypothetical protein